MSILPKGYKEGIPRVSSIVSFKYPFDGLAEDRFTQSLKEKGIEKKEYMAIANGWGTYLHKIAEDYILGNKLDLSLKGIHKEEIDGIKDYIDNLKERFPTAEWKPEYIVIDKFTRYQGTIDLVRINGNKVFLYDFKSYEVVKKNFPQFKNLAFTKKGVPYKPTDKLKKVSLQLSLYAQYFIQQGYEIGGIYLSWITPRGVFEYPADLWSVNDIDKLVTEYLFYLNPNTKDMQLDIDIKSPLKIKLQTSPAQYSAISVELDLGGLDTGQTAKEAINEAVLVQKQLHQSYLPKTD